MAERSKLDALDLIVRVLMDHEKTLNNIIERMDGLTSRRRWGAPRGPIRAEET